jgi:hypothetical protein
MVSYKTRIINYYYSPSITPIPSTSTEIKNKPLLRQGAIVRAEIEMPQKFLPFQHSRPHQ